MAFHATDSFPFGEIVMSCVSSPSLDAGLVVERVAVTPILPEGMAVELVAAYRVAFLLSDPIQHFSFDFKLAQCPVKGDANSGECLDAQSWPIRDGLLMIGTEDGATLNARMPWLNIQNADYPVEYLSNGFRIVIPYIAPNITAGFHFVLAYNQVEQGCGSEWFAVDIPHARICKFPVTIRFGDGNRGR